MHLLLCNAVYYHNIFVTDIDLVLRFTKRIIR